MYSYISPKIEITEYETTAGTKYSIYSTKVRNDSALEDMQKPHIGRHLEINEIALKIIRLFNGEKTYEEVINVLSKEYSEPYKTIKSKVDSFLNSLVNDFGYQISIQEKPIAHEIAYEKYANQYPATASIEITDRCNISCLHCYGSFDCQNSREISIDDARFLFKSLREIGVKIIEITGGDPSAHPLCAEIIEEAFNAGIKTVMLLTNGISLCNKLKTVLIERAKEMYIQIDLHSLNNEYYDWFTQSKNMLPKVKKNIEYLIMNGARIRTCAIITPGNIQELSALAEWSFSHGAIAFAPAPVVEIGRAAYKEREKLMFPDIDSVVKFNNQFKEVVKKYPKLIQDSASSTALKRKNCGALTTEISIRSDGTLKLCTLDSGDYFNLNLGNAFEKSIKSIYDENIDFINKMRDLHLPMWDSEECKTCSQNTFCSHCIFRGFLGAAKNKYNCKWFMNLDPELRDIFKIEE